MEDSDSHIDNDNPSLGAHEWLAVLTIVGFLLLLTCVVIIERENTSMPLERGGGREFHLKAQEVNVHIEGAVAKPGTYRVKAGMSIEEALKKAEPLPNASFSKIRLKSRVRNGQNIIVAEKPMITIHISGAVENAETIKVPKGTRLLDLENLVTYNADADIKKMSRKRVLKEGETIIVPSIQSKKPRKKTKGN